MYKLIPSDEEKVFLERQCKSKIQNKMKLTVNSNFPFQISAINYASDGNITITIESDAATRDASYRYEADFGRRHTEERVTTSLVQYASDFTGSHPVKEKTKASYRLMIRHLKDYGDVDMENISTAYLQGFITHLETHGLQRRTVRLYFQKLACVLHNAYKNDMFDDRILQRVKRPQRPQDRKCFLSEQEVRRLCQVKIPERQEGMRQMFLFSCMTGLRFSDVTKLKWTDVKRRNKHLYLDFMQQKTGSDETMPLCTQAENILMARERKGTHVFENICPQHANQTIKKWCRLARIKKNVSYHTSRHTFCVMLLSHDIPIFTVQQLMGHSDVRTTEVYADLLNRTKSKAVRKLPVFSRP